MNRVLTVESILGPGGALEGALLGYEHRPQQLEVARAVARALSERSYLVAEAGPGTGKTLAYLVPAVLSGRKVVISTATKTLQEQIFFRDIPLLQKSVGLDFGAAYLKGRSNYLCLQRFERFDLAPQFESREEAALWPRLRAWALATQTGDRAEVSLPDSFPAWGALSTTSDNCLGQKCPLYEPCHVTQARRRAESSDVLVVNHHLFFADLALRTSSRGSAREGILPPREVVIFDEAHALEDAAVEHFGCRVSSGQLLELAHDAQSAPGAADDRSGVLSALGLKLRGDSIKLFEAAAAALNLSREGSARLRPESLSPLGARLADVLEVLAALRAATTSAPEPELAALCRRSEELGAELAFVWRADRDDHVYWAEERSRAIALRAAPIDIAGELRRRLYSGVDTAIFTSATLTAEGRFDFFAQRVGLTGEGGAVGLRRVAVASPFDFSAQAALYLPTHLPLPQEPGFAEAVAEELLALCGLTQGRAFALFTSLRNLEAVYRLCRHRLSCRSLLQGERPKSALLDEFRAEPSVLFAAYSFWEGVDVPGDALSLVVMDKLPFASPQDPLVAARIEQLEEQGFDPFSTYQLPEAVIALRQGFGRLIRTQSDRGIVAVLDRRLATRSYGRTFLASLPPARRFASLEPLERWFRRER